MPSRGSCLVCAHLERARIELALANDPRDKGCARLAREYGINRKSMWRHWKKHVTGARKGRLRLGGGADPNIDIESLKRQEGHALLQNLCGERARLQRLADASELGRDFLTAIKASSGLVRLYELMAKFLGEIRTGTTINNTVLLSADWYRLRHTITQALRPYPEAQRAVVTALRTLEAASGVEVTRCHAIELAPAPLPAREESHADA